MTDYEFNRTLWKGSRVAVRWTWGGRSWCDTGIVDKLNRKSVRVRLEHGVRYSAEWSLSAGHVVSVPRYLHERWSQVNGVFPAEC